MEAASLHLSLISVSFRSAGDFILQHALLVENVPLPRLLEHVIIVIILTLKTIVFINDVAAGFSLHIGRLTKVFRVFILPIDYFFALLFIDQNLIETLLSIVRV